MVEDKLKTAFKNYFKSLYDKSISGERLDLYIKFMLGKELNALQVESKCGFIFDGNMTNREAFRYQYEFVYDSIPTEEQLDVFIAYRVGILKNDKLLNEVCSKNAQDIQPSL